MKKNEYTWKVYVRDKNRWKFTVEKESFAEANEQKLDYENGSGVTARVLRCPPY